MSDVTFTDGNLDEVIGEVVAAFSRPANTAQISDAMRIIIAQNFEREAGTYAWQQLAKSTQRDRARRGYDPAHPILQRTGSLLDSLINPSNSDHINEVEMDANGFAVGVGSNDERVPWLDDGTDNIPAREFLAADDVQEGQIADSIEMYFERLFQ